MNRSYFEAEMHLQDLAQGLMTLKNKLKSRYNRLEALRKQQLKDTIREIKILEEWRNEFERNA